MGARVVLVALLALLVGCGVAVKGQVGKYQFDVNLIKIEAGTETPAPR